MQTDIIKGYGNYTLEEFADFLRKVADKEVSEEEKNYVINNWFSGPPPAYKPKGIKGAVQSSIGLLLALSGEKDPDKLLGNIDEYFGIREKSEPTGALKAYYYDKNSNKDNKKKTFSYERCCEEVKPVLKDKKTLNDIIPELKEIIEKNSIRDNNIINNIFKSILGDTEKDEIIMNEIKISKIIAEAIENNKQVIFTGAPGTGKTYSVREYVKRATNDNEDFYKFVQFHPSYDYTDFVEGLRPVEINGETTFVKLDGVFKAFCRKIVADENNEHKYYFIVDEINRADLSKVFGELMFGLEESYRGIENRCATQYQNLPTYEVGEGGAKPMEFDCFKEGFYIPENLYFIGTMNDIDRSVESFDFALRRRFKWIDIKANDIMAGSLNDIWKDLKESEVKKEALIKNIKNMNEALTENSRFGLTEAYHIGPAYFKDFDGSKGSVDKIFEQKIEPIIREYLRGRKKADVDNLVDTCRTKLMNGIDNTDKKTNGQNDDEE